VGDGRYRGKSIYYVLRFGGMKMPTIQRLGVNLLRNQILGVVNDALAYTVLLNWELSLL